MRRCPRAAVLALLAAVVALLLLAPGASAQSRQGPFVRAELVASHSALGPGQREITVALRQSIAPGWHTYWKNPGDSGEPTRLDWTLPEGVSVGPIEWPHPKALPFGPLMNYGYEGELLLPMTLRLAPGLERGGELIVAARGRWLVCSDICVPEEADLVLTLRVAEAPEIDARWQPRLAEARARLPHAAPWPSGYVARGERFALFLAAPELATALSAGRVHGVHFYPESDGVLDHAAAQRVRFGPDGLSVETEAGYDLPRQAAEGLAVAGVLVMGETLEDGGRVERAFELSAAPADAIPGAMARQLFAPGASPPISLPLALAFAFLGGLILNLMPCVFPVLFLKALGILETAREAPRSLPLHGVAFTLGVLATFLLLAGALIGLRLAGAEIGWGFQLQSAPMVAVLALVMLAVGLNLSGVFEISSRLAGTGEGLARRGGAGGSFFTGVLAVVVATPCTAPFMAAALGAALVAPIPAALGIFLALGLGLAAPYLMLTLVPGLARLLPRPGAWMERLKRLLALPIYATFAWLVWVLYQQTDETGLGLFVAAALALALAALLFGPASSAMRRAAGLLATAVLTGALIAFTWRSPQMVPRATLAIEPGADLAFEPYSPARLAEARAAGEPVFLNVTAAWCITCLVSERMVLSRARVVDAFDRAEVTYLKADWTNRDPQITRLLERFGRSGVPLYVYYPIGGEPRILPQLLTEEIVLALFAEAAG